MKWLADKSIDYKAINCMLEVCKKSGTYVNGGIFSKKLENKFKEIAQISDEKEVIYVNSATSALHLAFRVIKIVDSQKSVVSTSAFTFPSVTQSQIFEYKVLDLDTNFEPIVESEDNVINVVTNLFGYVNNLAKYSDHFVVYDNSACPTGMFNNKSIHEFGFCSVVSLHHTKLIGFGEGGLLVIDKQYSQIARALLNFGFTDTERNFHPFGSNFKASEISAIYSLQFLETINDWLPRVRDNFYFLKNELKLTTLSDYSQDSIKNCFFYIHSERITPVNELCKKYYRPLAARRYATLLFDNCLCLPIHQDISRQDLIKICEDYKIV